MRPIRLLCHALSLVALMNLGGCKTGGETANEAATAPVAAPWADDSQELTLVNAYDAFGSPRAGLKHDFGFSTVIRHRGKTILFDAGTRADVFADNLRALGVSPGEIDVAVASHNHHDHIAGFDYLLKENPRVKLYLPPDFFGLGAPIPFSVAGKEPQAGEALPAEQRYFGGGEGSTALTIDSTGRFWNANVTWVSEPTEIAPGVRLVPTRSDLMGTFVRYPPHGETPKLIPMPELSLSLSTTKGQVLVVGCSHSSVEAIVKAAATQSKEPIALVAGGYHLLPYPRAEIRSLAKRLKAEHGVLSVAPCHCSGHVAFDEFQHAYGDAFLRFGLGDRLGF